MASGNALHTQRYLIYPVQPTWDLRNRGIATAVVLLPAALHALDALQVTGRPLSWSHFWRLDESAGMPEEKAVIKAKVAVSA
ncbi:UNVERIFIED_ORG: hypothetical protein FHR35_004506 [Microbispora rosea subsp. rosea]